ncbi:MAG TPA: hypothetical protein VGB89_06125 [Bacteroidota bacterium]
MNASTAIEFPMVSIGDELKRHERQRIDSTFWGKEEESWICRRMMGDGTLIKRLRKERIDPMKPPKETRTQHYC